MAEDKKDIKISFCGYNKNTTVGEIRKDFENLETAKSKVNEYRKTKYQNANEEKIDKSTSRITVWDFARMIVSSFSKNSFLLVLAAPSSSLISASVICLSI